MKRIYCVLCLAMAVVLYFGLTGCTYTHFTKNGDHESIEKYKLDTGILQEGSDVYLKVKNAGCDDVKQALAECKAQDQPESEPVPPEPKPEEQPPITPEEPEETEGPLTYNPRYHHTTSGSSDGGTSIVLCPDQPKLFRKCSVNGVNIPFHGKDNRRYIWWNMSKVVRGDMICVDANGKEFRFKADKPVRYGDC